MWNLLNEGVELQEVVVGGISGTKRRAIKKSNLGITNVVSADQVRIPDSTSAMP